MSAVDARLTAALADRYRLDRELGAGGMATVYLADDLKHDRQVAIKVLRPELAAVIGAERFLTEIKTTASLQHPHILRALRLRRGRRPPLLRHALRRGRDAPRPPQPREAAPARRRAPHHHARSPPPSTTPTATASSIATSSPRTSCCTTATALVADFGIALAAQQAGGARMTETGMSLGTPALHEPRAGHGRARAHRAHRRVRPRLR